MPKALDIRSILDQHKAAQAKAAGGGGGNYFKPPDGEFFLRVVPFLHEDQEELSLEFTNHFLGKGVGSPHCLKDVDEDCPTCNLSASYKAEGDKELANRIARRTKYAINVVQCDGSGKPTADPSVWEMSPTAFGDLTAWFANPEWGNIADLKSNYLVRVVKSGSGKDTVYSFQPSKNPVPLPKGNWYGKDLHEYLTYQSADEIQAMLDNAFSPASVDETGTQTEVVEEEQTETDAWKDEVFGPKEGDDSIAEEAARPTPKAPARKAPPVAAPKKPVAKKPVAPAGRPKPKFGR